MGRIRLQRLNQGGDTIVEVLLAIAVASFVLVGSFAVANTNLRDVRDAQERGEALKLAQAQVETLKQLVERSSASVFGPSAPRVFCFDKAGTQRPFPISAIPSDFQTDNFDNYPGGCDDYSTFYHVSIERGASGFFTIRVRWDRLGERRNEVKLLYRTLGSVAAAPTPPPPTPSPTPAPPTPPPPTPTPTPPPTPPGCSNSVISVPESLDVHVYYSKYMQTPVIPLGVTLQPCPYRIVINTIDEHSRQNANTAGQDGERLFIRFYSDAAGNTVVGQTGATVELPTARDSITTTMTFSLIGAARYYRIMHINALEVGGEPTAWNCNPQCQGSIEFGGASIFPLGS